MATETATCTVCELHAEAVFRVEGMDCNEEVVILERRLKPLVGLLTLEGRRLAMVQEFQPAVVQGDKRVLLLDGQLLGAIRRVPQAGDIRANIHVGGRVERAELTAEEVSMVQLAKDMEKFRLFFLEDPLAPEDVQWFQTMRQQSSTPIAMGELFVNRNEWLGLK